MRLDQGLWKLDLDRTWTTSGVMWWAFFGLCDGWIGTCACWFSTSLMKNLSIWVFDLAESFCLLARNLLVIFWRLRLIQKWWTLGLESRKGCEVWHVTMSFGFLAGERIGYLAAWWFSISLETSELSGWFIRSVLRRLLGWWRNRLFGSLMILHKFTDFRASGWFLCFFRSPLSWSEKGYL